jgi:hypothetical protein
MTRGDVLAAIPTDLCWVFEQHGAPSNNIEVTPSGDSSSSSSVVSKRSSSSTSSSSTYSSGASDSSGSGSGTLHVC